LFAFELADHKGIWDVDAMLASMPRSLLVKWKAFYRYLRPRGFGVEDERHAWLCAAITHSKRGPEVFRWKPPVDLEKASISLAQFKTLWLGV